jgi:hypothetical protein
MEEIKTLEQVPQAMNLLNAKMDAIIEGRQVSDLHRHKKLLTIDELRDILPGKPARQTIYGLACKHQIPYEKHGKRLYFDSEKIDQWLSNGRQMK